MCVCRCFTLLRSSVDTHMSKQRNTNICINGYIDLRLSQPFKHLFTSTNEVGLGIYIFYFQMKYEIHISVFYIYLHIYI
jgi:hypothetical protein